MQIKNIFKRIFFKKKGEEKEKENFNTRANSIIACSDCERFMTEYACIDCPYKKKLK